MRGAGLLLLASLLAGCDRGRAAESAPARGSGGSPTDKAPPSADSASPARTLSSPPSSAGRPLPLLEGVCQKDQDCEVSSDEISGPTACCPGCTWRAASKTSLQRFRAACQASPSPMCPPIGCAMPLVEPRCAAGTCVAVSQK